MWLSVMDHGRVGIYFEKMFLGCFSEKFLVYMNVFLDNLEVVFGRIVRRNSRLRMKIFNFLKMRLLV